MIIFLSPVFAKNILIVYVKKKVELFYFFIVQVSVVADSVNISGQNCAIQFKVPDCSLSDDIGDLFESQKFSDVILSVNGKEFFAHKAILAGKENLTFFMSILIH